MNSKAAAAILALLSTLSLLAFAYMLRQLSFVSIGLAAHNEVEQQLRQSLDDQKKLARLDPGAGPRYRERFDSVATLLGHLRVVELNRRDVTRQVEQLLLGVVGLILACGSALYLLERRAREQRLVRLETAVAALSRGESEIVLGERRSDVIGRIAAAVERSARAAAQDRRRLRYLEHLSAWQEAARRHAHEMRTPLTAARMDVERFTATVQQQLPGLTPEIDAARTSLLEELDRLREFTRSFTSFATIPKPRPRPMDLRQFVTEFCETFGPAWPKLKLVVSHQSHTSHRSHRSHGTNGTYGTNGTNETYAVSADGEMLRQVLVNLTNNSALATGDHEGTVTFTLSHTGELITLDVTDTGPGILPEIRNRLFEPYTTSRGIGEGMGLGLAISKKILLDHGGDLDSVDGDAGGATFRLTLPALAPAPETAP